MERERQQNDSRVRGYTVSRVRVVHYSPWRSNSICTQPPDPRAQRDTMTIGMCITH